MASCFSSSFFCLDTKETKDQDWNSQQPTNFSECKKQKLNADLLIRHFKQLAFLHIPSKSWCPLQIPRSDFVRTLAWFEWINEVDSLFKTLVTYNFSSLSTRTPLFSIQNCFIPFHNFTRTNGNKL